MDFICIPVPLHEQYPLETDGFDSDSDSSVDADQIYDNVKGSGPNVASDPNSKDAKENDHRSRAALLTACRWTPGETINVHFIKGSPRLHDRVKEYSKEWTNPKHKHACLTFTFDERKKSQIRISFLGEKKLGGGNWSRVGTEARDVPDGEATMNLAIHGRLLPRHIRRIVLHEFGHAIGFVHEHSSPASSIHWNREEVLKVHKALSGWDENSVEENIFKRYVGTQTQFSEFDKESVMIYPIPATWTTDGFLTPSNPKPELSDTDRQYAAKWYPSPVARATSPTRARTANQLRTPASTLHGFFVSRPSLFLNGRFPGSGGLLELE